MAERLNIVDDAGRSLVLRHQDGGKGPLLLDLGRHGIGIGSLAQREGELGDVAAKSRRDLGKAISKDTATDGQHAIARRERVDDGRLHAASARGCQHIDILLGLEKDLEHVDNLAEHGLERRASMADHLLPNRFHHLGG